MGVEEDVLLDEEESGEYNLVAIGIVAMVVLAIIGGLVWFFVLKEDSTKKEADILPKWVAPVDLSPELVYDGMERLIINPADSRGRYYLVVKVDIAFNRDVRAELLSNLWKIPKAKNIIIDVFSAYTVAELQTLELKEEARLEIKYEFNKLMGWKDGEPESKKSIREIYLVEFILN